MPFFSAMYCVGDGTAWGDVPGWGRSGTALGSASGGDEGADAGAGGWMLLWALLHIPATSL